MLHGLGGIASSCVLLHAGECPWSLPGLGIDAVHGSICVCHLLLRCPIVCLSLFFAAHHELLLWVSVASAGGNGGRPVGTLLYSRTG